MADDSAKQRESRLLPGFWRLAEMQVAFFVAILSSVSVVVLSGSIWIEMISCVRVLTRVIRSRNSST